MSIDLRKNWWILIAAVSGVGFVVLVLATELFPAAESYALILFTTSLGLSFLWVFGISEKTWWAVAPGTGLLAFAVMGVLSPFIPENNGWIGMMMLAFAAFVIAAIPNPRPEMRGTGFAVGSGILMIGFLLFPVGPMWKLVLFVVYVPIGLTIGYLLRKELGYISTKKVH